MLIGWLFTDLQCGGTERSHRPGGLSSFATRDRTQVGQEDRRGDAEDDGNDDGCGLIIAGGTVGGSILGAGGVSVVSVMVLRAMGEWRTKLDAEVTPEPRA